MNLYADDTTVSHQDADAIRGLFLGRSIQSVENNVMTLDDGTRLLVEGNDGCGGCPDGYFEVMMTDGFQNRIMNVEVVERNATEQERTDENWAHIKPREVFELFVYGSGPGEEGSLIAQVAGDIGNGYYGWGFKIRVISEN
jgi:hypothetical protein